MSETSISLNTEQDFNLSLINFCREYSLLLTSGEIVLIGGLSRSGKTTLANNLRQAVFERGLNAWTISIDRWLKNVDSRSPGVLGRYDLSIIRDVISYHYSKEKVPKNLQLPYYDKVQQKSIHSDHSILIHPTDILIIEGTVALTLATNLKNIKRLYVEADELLRKQRVINEYLSRGKRLSEALIIYNERQLDETPVIKCSSTRVRRVYF
jgi:uridine kinase